MSVNPGRKWLAVIVAILWLTQLAEPAVAVTVRSGDHARFSRLVFEFNPASGWRLEPTEDGYHLTIGPVDGALDLSGVFRLISHKRLRSISPVSGDGGQWKLELAPSHHAEAVELRPGKLVIDIKPGRAAELAGVVSRPAKAPSEPASIVPVSGIAAQLPEPVVQSAILVPPAQRLDRSETQPDPFGSGHTLRATPEAVHKPVLAARPVPGPSRTAHLEMPLPLVLNMQNTLAFELGRAMSYGIIEPAKTPSSDDTPDVGAQADARWPQQSPRVSARKPEAGPSPGDGVLAGSRVGTSSFLPGLPNLRVHNAFDHGSAGVAGDTQKSGDDRSCVDPSVLDLSGAIPEGSHEQVLPDLRSGLVGEFDTADRGKLDALLRYYLATGFGAEAQMLISAFEGTFGSQSAILGELAELIETGTAREDGVLSTQFGCPGQGDIWSILARGEIPNDQTVAMGRIEAMFSDLPAPLRRRVGPWLGERFLHEGLLDEAEMIARVIARAPGPDGRSATLLRARLKLVKGQDRQARKLLEALVGTNTRTDADTLLLLLETYRNEPSNIPENLIFDLGALAFEFRGSEDGKRLLRGYMTALSKRDRQLLAFEILKHELDVGSVSLVDARDIAHGVFRSFDPARLEDVGFVRGFYEYGAFLAKTPDGNDARMHVADALLVTGLPEEAIRVLSSPSLGKSQAARLLLARANLDAGRPDRTLDILSGRDSLQADILRKRAFSALGEYDHALGVASSRPELGDIPDLAWRAGRFDVVSGTGKGARRSAARYALGRSGGEEDSAFTRHLAAPDELSLSGLNGLLEDSRLSRKSIDRLLMEAETP